jgi:hypothetical protein
MLFLAFAIASFAQVQTYSSTQQGTPTQDVKVESGEVVAVQGNDLWVKTPDGVVHHFPNVPESAKVDVGGQQLGIHDLKPGMTLTRTTVTTTTPMVVTTIQTVKGKVWSVTPPDYAILTMDNNQNKAFTIPPGTKFMVDGQPTDVFALRKGMVVTATKAVEAPETEVTKTKQLTGTIPPDAPVVYAKAGPAPAPAPAAAPADTTTTGTTTTASAALPKTASLFPLVGLLGFLSVAVSLGMRWLRRF